MKKFLFLIFVFVTGSGALLSSAAAGPVVEVGSRYALYIEGTESGQNVLIGADFDSATSTIERAGLTLAVSETETSLGGGKSHITISIVADGELFPLTGDGAVLSVGLTDPLDIISQVSLDHAKITFLDATKAILAETANLAGQVPQNRPWGGAFPAPSDIFIIEGVGGLGVSRINFDFTVGEFSGEVPEPGSLLLGGIALVAAVSARARRRKIGTDV